MKLSNGLLRYPLLAAAVFVAHAFSGFLEEMVMAGDKLAWVYLFLWYTIFLAAGDYLITRFMKE